MNAVEIQKDVFCLSANARDLLFEELWNIPDGVSLNSYIVKGEKTAIIDGICGWDQMPETLYALLEKIDVKPSDINYLIINHMEPDHSGWIEDFKKINSDFKIYCTKPAASMLKTFYNYDFEIETVKTGDSLDLGNGKIIEFKLNPWVHWPDTMFSYEKSTETLFTCDMFGSFGELKNSIFASDINSDSKEKHFDNMIRYYSNVLSAYNKECKKAIDLVEELTPKTIAPGHGPIYKENTNEIIDLYKKITAFQCGEPLDELCIIYGSMYGMTEKAIFQAKKILEEKNVNFSIHKTSSSTIGDIISSAIRAKSIILGSPTYENKMFPPMAQIVDELGRKKILGKKVLHLGSFGWSGGANRELLELVEKYKLNWDMPDKLEFKGNFKEEDIELLREKIEYLL